MKVDQGEFLSGRSGDGVAEVVMYTMVIWMEENSWEVSDCGLTGTYSTRTNLMATCSFVCKFSANTTNPKLPLLIYFSCL